MATGHPAWPGTSTPVRRRHPLASAATCWFAESAATPPAHRARRAIPWYAPGRPRRARPPAQDRGDTPQRHSRGQQISVRRPLREFSEGRCHPVRYAGASLLDRARRQAIHHATQALDDLAQRRHDSLKFPEVGPDRHPNFLKAGVDRLQLRQRGAYGGRRCLGGRVSAPTPRLTHVGQCGLHALTYRADLADGQQLSDLCQPGSQLAN